jgi:hypothetical protein
MDRTEYRKSGPNAGANPGLPVLNHVVHTAIVATAMLSDTDKAPVAEVRGTIKMATT